MKKKLAKTVAKKLLKKTSKVVTTKAKKSLVKKITSKAPKKIVATNKASKRKPVSIRMLTTDISAIKIKAAKLGVPYQTYINILIHRDAMSA